jgi:uncharacterized membrane protein
MQPLNFLEGSKFSPVLQALSKVWTLLFEFETGNWSCIVTISHSSLQWAIFSHTSLRCVFLCGLHLL